MIHPGLDDLRLEQPDSANESSYGSTIEDTWSHPDRPSWNPGCDDAVGKPKIVDQRDDHRLESVAIGPGQKVAEHYLCSAVFEAVDDMENLNFHDQCSVAWGEAGRNR